jgi:hypothetical protein
VVLHEGCLPSATVAHQDELELDLRLFLGGHLSGSFQKSHCACPTGAGKMAEARFKMLFLFLTIEFQTCWFQYRATDH